MTTSVPIVDADGHVLEPADTWLKYIDPDFKDRAIRIERDNEGREVLLFDNKPLESLRGQLGALGGIELEDGELARIDGEYTYEMGSPAGGYEPHARLKVMDEEGIDKVLLYPTIGICWEGHVTDPALATAYTRAYNRWLVDFCKTDPNRLYPVAHISLIDPKGAVDEVIRARKEGCVGVYLSPDLAARSGKQFTHPDFVPFWSTVQDLDMPVGFHVVVRDKPAFSEFSGTGRESSLFFFAFLPQFVAPAASSVPLQIFLLGSLFVLLAVITDGAYALLAGTAGDWLRCNQRFLRAQRYLSGGMYVALGVAAAVSGNGRE